MKTLSVEECHEFLMQSTRTGKLATVRDDGRAHVVPIWFYLDGEDLVFTTWYTSVKAVNMRRDPRVCLCVDDERPPFGFVQVEGRVTFSDDPEALKQWATRIGGRYMGAGRAEEYGQRNSVEGELLVRLTPTKIIGRRDIAD